MKNLSKLFGIIALIAVIGFSMAACGEDGGGNDPFKGTWVNEQDGMKIVAAGGTFKVSRDNNGNWYEIMQGTYSGEGNDITAVITKVNAGLMNWDGEGSKPVDLWVDYDKLPDDAKNMFPKNIPISITNNQLTAMDTTFTKQGGSSNSGGTNSGGTNSGGTNSGGSNNGSSQPPGSIFRLTRPRSDHVGKYAVLYAQNDYGDYFIGAESITVNASGMSGKAVKVTGGSVDLPMWILLNDGRKDRYHGDDTVVATIMIFNSQNVSEGAAPIAQKYFIITFSDGAATKEWDDGQDQPPDNFGSDGGGADNGGSSGGSTDKSLYGTWFTGTQTITFNSDGTLEGTQGSNPITKGTYTINGNNITIQYNSVYGGSATIQQIGTIFGITYSTTKWYSYKEMGLSTPASSSDKENYAKMLTQLFSPIPGNYSIDGNTLTMTMQPVGSSDSQTTTWTKQK